MDTALSFLVQHFPSFSAQSPVPVSHTQKPWRIHLEKLLVGQNHRETLLTKEAGPAAGPPAGGQEPEAGGRGRGPGAGNRGRGPASPGGRDGAAQGRLPSCT